ncbi:IS1595 family transposase, partial [Helicobacter pylori]
SEFKGIIKECFCSIYKECEFRYKKNLYQVLFKRIREIGLS